MNNRYPYRHHGPAVYGSKVADYLISEANMIKAGLLPAPEDMKLLGPDEEPSVTSDI